MSFTRFKVIRSNGNPLLTNGDCCCRFSFKLIWLTVFLGLIGFNCDRVFGQSINATTPEEDDDHNNNNETFIQPWTNLNVICENGLQTWNSCFDEAIDYWSSVNDLDKRDCCTSWHLFNCWSYQVKIVCSDIDPTLLEQSRINLSNQTRCMKYYDLSVCMAKPLPVWANILILSFGATLITGAAIFVYWRWIRLI